MDATTYLQKTFANINSVFHSFADDLTDEEWVARPVPGYNLIGYIAWHVPRTQDAHVHTWIRGVPEVMRSDRWAHWQTLKRFGNGVGISLAEADQVAQNVQKHDVMEYADAVLHAITAWLKEINENDLDHLPEIPQHLSYYPEYQTPGFIEEAKDLFNQPVWAQFMRPCIGHIHRHLGEIEVLKTILRVRN